MAARSEGFGREEKVSWCVLTPFPRVENAKLIDYPGRPCCSGTLVYEPDSDAMVWIYVSSIRLPLASQEQWTDLVRQCRIYSITKRYENRYVSKFRDEIIGLSVLWLFWMVGTAVATVSVLAFSHKNSL